MSGFWLVSYVVLWILVIVAGLVLLALAREVESLHRKLDSIQKYRRKVDASESTKNE